MGIGDYPNFVNPNERHLHSVSAKERKQMTLRVLNADELLMIHPEAHESMIEDDSERDEQEDDWSKWRFYDGFMAPAPDGTVVGERRRLGIPHNVVWSGTRWIEPAEVSGEEDVALLDVVAKQLPGGLHSWK